MTVLKKRNSTDNNRMRLELEWEVIQLSMWRQPPKHLPESLYFQSAPTKYTQLYSQQHKQVHHAVFCTIEQNPMNSLVWIPTLHVNAQNWFLPSFYVIGSWEWVFLSTLFYPLFKWITQQAPDPSFQPCCLFIYFFLSPSFSLLHFRWKVAKEWLWQPCLISLSGNFGFPPPPPHLMSLYSPESAVGMKGARPGEWPLREESIKRWVREGRGWRERDGKQGRVASLPRAGHLCWQTKAGLQTPFVKKSGREERLLFTGAETIVGFVVPEGSPGVREKGPS